MPTFAARLRQKIAEHSPLCVGIDPSAALLKSCNLPTAPDGAFEFGGRVLEAADFAARCSSRSRRSSGASAVPA